MGQIRAGRERRDWWATCPVRARPAKAGLIGRHARPGSRTRPDQTRPDGNHGILRAGRPSAGRRTRAGTIAPGGGPDVPCAQLRVVETRRHRSARWRSPGGAERPKPGRGEHVLVATHPRATHSRTRPCGPPVARCPRSGLPAQVGRRRISALRRQRQTTSSRWLIASWRKVTIPASGRERLSFSASTQLSARSVSPMKTGFGITSPS